MRISDWSSDVCSSDLTGMWRILWCPPFPYGPATGSLKHPTHPEILPGLPNGAADIAKRAEAAFRYSGYLGKSFHPDIAVHIGAGDPRREACTKCPRSERRRVGKEW